MGHYLEVGRGQGSVGLIIEDGLLCPDPLAGKNSAMPGTLGCGMALAPLAGVLGGQQTALLLGVSQTVGSLPSGNLCFGPAQPNSSNGPHMLLRGTKCSPSLKTLWLDTLQVWLTAPQASAGFTR